MHAIKLCAVGVLLQLVATTTQAQQPATLTLACKGTVTSSSDAYGILSEPLSMGIVINFTAHIVQGFPGADYPVGMTANDVTVTFSGRREWDSISGSIDRVTGNVEADYSSYYGPERKTLFRKVYSLQCKPAQRMF